MTEDEQVVAARQIVRLARTEEWQGFARWVTEEYQAHIDSLIAGNASEENWRYVAGQANALKAILNAPEYAAAWLQLRQEAREDG